MARMVRRGLVTEEFRVASPVRRYADARDPVLADECVHALQPPARPSDGVKGVLVWLFKSLHHKTLAIGAPVSGPRVSCEIQEWNDLFRLGHLAGVLIDAGKVEHFPAGAVNELQSGKHDPSAVG